METTSNSHHNIKLILCSIFLSFYSQVILFSQPSQGAPPRIESVKLVNRTNSTIEISALINSNSHPTTAWLSIQIENTWKNYDYHKIENGSSNIIFSPPNDVALKSNTKYNYAIYSSNQYGNTVSPIFSFTTESNDSSMSTNSQYNLNEAIDTLNQIAYDELQNKDKESKKYLIKYRRVRKHIKKGIKKLKILEEDFKKDSSLTLLHIDYMFAIHRSFNEIESKFININKIYLDKNESKSAYILAKHFDFVLWNVIKQDELIHSLEFQEKWKFLYLNIAIFRDYMLSNETDTGFNNSIFNNKMNRIGNSVQDLPLKNFMKINVIGKCPGRRLKADVIVHTMKFISDTLSTPVRGLYVLYRYYDFDLETDPTLFFKNVTTPSRDCIIPGIYKIWVKDSRDSRNNKISEERVEYLIGVRLLESPINIDIPIYNY